MSQNYPFHAAIIFFVFAFLSIFLWPWYRNYSEYKINSISSHQETSSINQYLLKIFLLLTGLHFLSPVCGLFFKETYQYFIPMNFMPGFLIGMIVIIFALFWIGFAQFTMGKFWRIGLNEKHDNLITEGPFEFSRNPIYAGMIFLMFGHFLLTPNVYLIIISLFTFIVFEIQIRVEEEHLKNIFKDRYLDYQNKVRRYF